MANNDGGRPAATASVPLAVLWLAACAVPDSTGGPADAEAAALGEARPVVAEPASLRRGYGAGALAGASGTLWTPASAGASDIPAMIVAEARQGGVPPALALAVAQVGSNIASRALNATGAVGTMQIPPALADEFDLDVDDLPEPAANIRAGIACLAALQERYAGDWQLVLSHYRGGILKEARGTFVPHPFTWRYVRDVLRWWRLYRHDPLTGAWLRKVQGLPRFAPGSGGGRSEPVPLAARPALEAAEVGGRWRTVAGGPRFR